MIMNHRITIRDLAKAAGVSVTTVSQILNGKGARFSPATRDRVLALKEQMNYVPDFNARNLILRSSKTIGVMIPNIANPFFAAFIKGVQEATRQAGFMPLIFSADHESDQERYYLERLVERSVDGLIISSASVTRDTIDDLLKPRQIPYLLFDQNEMADGDRVAVDADQGGYLVAEHLLGLGHQQFALLFPDQPTANIRERAVGFVRGLATAGINFDSDRSLVTGSLTKRGGYQATAAVLATGATAVFAANDEMAIGLYRGLAERGLRVPRDLSVVGFDDIDLAEYVSPKLTTVAQPIEEIGIRVAELLVHRIQHPDAAPTKMILPVKLVVRDSTAPVEKANPDVVG